MTDNEIIKLTEIIANLKQQRDEAYARLEELGEQI